MKAGKARFIIALVAVAAFAVTQLTIVGCARGRVVITTTTLPSGEVIVTETPVESDPVATADQYIQTSIIIAQGFVQIYTLALDVYRLTAVTDLELSVAEIEAGIAERQGKIDYWMAKLQELYAAYGGAPEAVAAE